MKTLAKITLIGFFTVLFTSLLLLDGRLAQGVADRSDNQMHVYDASGQDLGVLIDYENNRSTPRQFTTYLPSLRRFLRIASLEDPSRISLGERFNVFFDGSGCTGNAFSSGFYYQDILGAYGGRYFVSKGESHATRTFVSYLTSEGCLTSSGATGGVPVYETSLPFTEPLVWPLFIK